MISWGSIPSAAPLIPANYLIENIRTIPQVRFETDDNWLVALLSDMA